MGKRVNLYTGTILSDAHDKNIQMYSYTPHKINHSLRVGKIGLARKFGGLSKLFFSKLNNYFSNQSIINPKAPRWATGVSLNNETNEFLRAPEQRL